MPIPKQVFDKLWNAYVEDDRRHGAARRARNPFKRGDVVECIARVSEYNISPGDTGVCSPENEHLIRFNGSICPAENFRKLPTG